VDKPAAKSGAPPAIDRAPLSVIFVVFRPATGYVTRTMTVLPAVNPLEGLAPVPMSTAHEFVVLATLFELT